ncbi:MAG TPA: LamG domain-containing protein [Planctomycetota bacterium]|nr:LamG domain-containing protein [Planctomycetota bacterium]
MTMTVRRSMAWICLRILATLLVTGALGFRAAPTLVLYYKFDEAAGTTAVDSSGNGFNGTWTPANGSMAASAVGDCAPNVSGNTRSLILTMPGGVTQDGAYVDCPNNATLTFTGPFSAMAWIKPTGYAVGQNPNNTSAIVQKWDYGTNQLSGYAFNRNQAGKAEFITGSRTATDYMVGNQVIPTGVWTHLAVVYDGTNKVIYINGVQDATQVATVVPASSTADLHVGKDDWARNYYGNVDEVKLFNGALTATEVLELYDGIDPPANLTATAGPGLAKLNWTAAPNATGYNIFRSGTSGGPPSDPYQLIGTVNSGTTTTYTDTGVTFPNTYYYVVQSVEGTLTSIYSNEASCSPLQIQITASPTALMVAEAGGTATFTVTLTTNPTSQVVIQIASGNPGALTLTGPSGPPSGTVSLTFNPGGPPSQTVTVTGVEQHVEGPDLIVPINFTAVTSTDPNYPSTYLPPSLSCTVVEDRPALIVNPPSGLATVNGGPPVTFTVQLSTIPNGAVALNLSVSDPNVAMVSPTLITTAAWNNPVTVTVTPNQVNTQTTYIANYDIIIDPSASTDPAYASLGDTLVPISTPTSLPPLKKVWAGCGMTGMEGCLAVGLLAFLRRRRLVAMGSTD